ncbi:hypothetical protein LRD69_01975 [Streptomyces sp. JH14]|uniref:ArnT family glycosyltransferase n=1 Tax=Streptomyces sp. JH14 TaxID=2793630 RepID=UPI0023F7D945|nr:hypothetical protein [Streptomyces sp. JH14]MDF6040955.1 hypothetical protein [Streptomyces sp. JH14]
MHDRLAVDPRVAQMRLSDPDHLYDRPFPWLAAVAAVFTFVQLVLVVPGSGLGWDETVYVSQVSRDVPAAFFSAPRARGISYLVAPVAVLTSSTAALHVYLALCSGCGLFLALWVWRRLLPPVVLAGAGAMFAGLWITLYYGPKAMPNLWCALGALAAVGCFLRAVRGKSDGKALVGLGCGVALVALMRPPDACYLVLPLIVAALAVPRWRRPAVPAVLVAALLLGSAPWIIEAYLHYGGLTARLHRASEIQGGLGRHFAVDDQIRALDGRTLCRPCEVPWRHRSTAAWWFALPLLTAGGIVAAGTRRPAVVLATLVAASMATPYLFMIDYAAPRFLLPTYALLALPVAECVRALFLAARPAWRPTVGVLLAFALAGHFAVQYWVLSHAVARSRVARQEYTAIADQLHLLGVRPPCVVTGYDAVPIGYYAGCASRQIGGHDGSITADGLLAAARRAPVAVIVTPGRGAPAYAHAWQKESLPPLRGGPALTVHLAPTEHMDRTAAGGPSR